MPASKKSRTSLSLPKLAKRERSAVPRSQTERLWFMAGGIIAFVMLLVGYFFFISPQRSNTSNVNGQANTVQQQNLALQARLEALQEQNKNIGKYQAELNALHQALPSSTGISDFVRMLQSLGNATFTDVQALSVGDPAPVVAPVAATTDSATATTAPSPTATTTSPAAGVPAAPAASAYSMQINASVTGSASGLSKFLDQLQSVQPRAVLISSVSLGSATTTGGSGRYTLSLAMQAFVASSTAGAPLASTSAAGA